MLSVSLHSGNSDIMWLKSGFPEFLMIGCVNLRLLSAGPILFLGSKWFFINSLSIPEKHTSNMLGANYSSSNKIFSVVHMCLHTEVQSTDFKQGNSTRYYFYHYMSEAILSTHLKRKIGKTLNKWIHKIFTVVSFPPFTIPDLLYHSSIHTSNNI